jgi:hypothetical protein
MLPMRMEKLGRSARDCIFIEPPYELVKEFLCTEVQWSVAGATSYLKMLRAVMDGTHRPLELDEGNAWALTGDGEWMTLSNDYGAPVSVRIPTAWLVDAIERWRQFMIDHGAPLDR